MDLRCVVARLCSDEGDPVVVVAGLVDAFACSQMLPVACSCHPRTDMLYSHADTEMYQEVRMRSRTACSRMSSTDLAVVGDRSFAARCMTAAAGCWMCPSAHRNTLEEEAAFLGKIDLVAG